MTDLKSDYSDFSPGHIVCEIRYPGAYLIFDRTGSIWHALKLRFPSLSVVFGSPQQTSFKADSYTFNVEAEIACVSCIDPVSVDIEAFQDRCSFFFPLVLGTLEILTLNRAGLRQFLVKKFATKVQGRTFLKGFNRTGGYIPRWLGEEESNTEVLYQVGEGFEVGGKVRLKTALEPPVNTFRLTPSSA